MPFALRTVRSVYEILLMAAPKAEMSAYRLYEIGPRLDEFVLKFLTVSLYHYLYFYYIFYV